MATFYLPKFVLMPIPELDPLQVVKIQMKGLKENDEFDNGIRAAFVFASPANKLVTGPMERFARMVKNPLYKPMLNYKAVNYRLIKAESNEVQVLVTLMTEEDDDMSYIFTLSKQNYGDYYGCWMTDGVQLVEAFPL